MKIIEEISSQIDEEIGDAEHYAKRALELKDEYKSLADLYYNLSQEELDHASRLHDEVVKLIQDYRAKHGEPPADMLAVYNYVHKHEMSKESSVRVMQNMYRG